MIVVYNNVGKKIKDLARAACWIGIILSLIYGFWFVSSSNNIFGGMQIIGIGIFVFWVSNIVLYGFGQLVDNSDYMVQLMEEQVGIEHKDAGSMLNIKFAPAEIKEGFRKQNVDKPDSVHVIKHHYDEK